MLQGKSSDGLSSVNQLNNPCNVIDVRVSPSKNVAGTEGNEVGNLPSWKK